MTKPGQIGKSSPTYLRLGRHQNGCDLDVLAPAAAHRAYSGDKSCRSLLELLTLMNLSDDLLCGIGRQSD
jgi:hypothetical protein